MPLLLCALYPRIPLALQGFHPRSAAQAGADFRDPESFERVIFLKQNAAWLLERDLRRIDPACEIALGTATDPYQPIERKAGITRSVLEVFARKQGYNLGIVTKSTLIERDIDLLVEIGRRNRLSVHITITTPDAKLARKLEPRAPRPDLRFATVRRLREAGIRAGVLCCPLLPGITDTQKAIDGMARRAAAVGASFFAGNPLFLKPCSRPTYFQFVRENFPELVADYESRFGAADFAKPTYSRQMAKLVEQACRRHGLPVRFHDNAVLPRGENFDPDPGAPHTDASARIPPQRAADVLPAEDCSRSLGIYGASGGGALGGAPWVRWRSRNSWNSVPKPPSAIPSSVLVTVTCTLCRSLLG